ncbi:MAG TPA: TonB-dependent receptor [Fibrobacteria bacterium]|nr:TonB-dependent receptor [Fibrobacteria bacterium]
MNPSTEVLGTHQKALRVNLDARRYGTFAEIGAGQEVVRWFFRVGGAAGTVSKSMSAYDMTVSDAIYGKCDRYVARPRLQSMLDYEFDLNLNRLQESRGDSTAFFAFADTVSARNFQGTNEQHGWMGVKFQAHPRDEASQIIIHVRMLDNENLLQQEALGIVGVNLLYGAFFMSHEPELLVESMLDGLSTSRIEIDMVEFSGIEFRHVDNRLMSLDLVRLGLSKAAMFSAKGEVLQPSEVLHKRSILVERGSFRPVCTVNLDMMSAAMAKLREESSFGEEPLEIMEITMSNLASTESRVVDHRDFLARADMLSACGKTVLISDHSEFFRLGAWLSRFTRQRIAIVLGAQSLQQLFDESFYQNLDGGILEGFGRLFKNDLRLYVYPFLDPATDILHTAKDISVPHPLTHLHEYLLDRGVIEDVEKYDPSCLKVFSRQALAYLKSGNPAWIPMVPPEVAEVIRKNGHFGWKKDQ